MYRVKSKDWIIERAGQRVQVIKKIKKGGILEFGTEVITTADGSLSVLLGFTRCLDGSFDYDRRSGKMF
jgi:L-2-hydroxyglutarate oxidase LhgO